MRIIKKTFGGNPYIGLFTCTTDKICLASQILTDKDVKELEDVLNVEVIRTEISNTNLIGVFLAGNSKGFILPEITEKSELKMFEEQGIPHKVIHGHYTALGNLVAANDKGCFISKIILDDAVKEIKEFFGDINYRTDFLGKSELVGSSTVATNKGFLVTPNIEEEEFEAMEKIFQVSGQATTANYGDPFVRHSVIANSFGVAIGEQTSGPEILRIDDGLDDVEEDEEE